MRGTIKMSPNSRKINWVLILGIALGIAGLAVFLYFGFPKEVARVKNELLLKSTPDSERQEIIDVKLYFGSKTSKGLAIENRKTDRQGKPVDQAREIVAELILGPQKETLVSAIPKDTALRELYIDKDGCAYVDLSPHIKSNHPGGSYAELQTIYSLVNSLTANIASIKSVKILVGGLEINTLAGHIDTRKPFTTN